MTLHEWAELPEDEPGELVDGRLEEEERPTYNHETVVAWLLVLLGAWVLPKGGNVTGSETKFAVGPRRGRKPDLSVYLPEATFPPGETSLVRQPPSLLVEVISPRPRDAKRDRVDKVDDYARFGVRWYWLVDPGLRTLEIYELGKDGRYTRALGVGEGKVPVPGCEGLVIDLDGLWAHVQKFSRVDEEKAPVAKAGSAKGLRKRRK